MTSLAAIHADITTVKVDVIVNAANTELTPGGGVCGAIHRAAGPELAQACQLLGGCKTGEAKVTPAYRLPARRVVHAVGPVWQGGTQSEAELLASCYRHALEIVAREGLHTVAFPAISTGIYGYPIKQAAQIAIATVRDFVRRPSSIEHVVFCCYSAADHDVYDTLLHVTADS
jgi:O-acetyl-ADP-ribose deacetylase